MTPEAAVETMAVSTVERVIEWGQCDPAGIVFFPRYYEMCDAAAADLFVRALGEGKAAFAARHGIVGVPMVAQQARFLAPCSHGDRIAIESRVTAVGRSSIAIRHRISRADALAVDRLAVEITETRVWVARRSAAAHDIGAVPIPPDVAARLRGEPLRGVA